MIKNDLVLVLNKSAKSASSAFHKLEIKKNGRIQKTNITSRV